MHPTYILFLLRIGLVLAVLYPLRLHSLCCRSLAKCCGPRLFTRGRKMPERKHLPPNCGCILNAGSKAVQGSQHCWIQATERWGEKGSFAWMCELIRSHLSMIGSCRHSNECATRVMCFRTGNAAALDGRELGESDLISRERKSMSFASFCSRLA